jgi:pyridoxine 4-dehydrogenase
VSIPIVAYSPVSRGWLTGTFRKVEDVPANNPLFLRPRFAPENFDQNYKLVEAVEKIAKRKDLVVSQVAIAWVVKHGAIPIPGSSNADRIALNSEIVDLTDDDMEELQQVLDTFPVMGERYGGEQEKFLNA